MGEEIKDYDVLNNLPDKLFFSISDVSDITGIKPYVLRYWETQFKALKPNKNSGGQRAYRKKDIELILEIKGMLYEDRYTISGAQQKLKDFRKNAGPQLTLDFNERDVTKLLNGIKDQLRALIQTLS